MGGILTTRQEDALQFDVAPKTNEGPNQKYIQADGQQQAQDKDDWSAHLMLSFSSRHDGRWGWSENGRPRFGLSLRWEYARQANPDRK